MKRLSSPWAAASTWRTLAHLMLGPVVGAAAFTFVVTLTAVSLALLITFPLALPFIWLLFTGAPMLGAIERSRLASLLGLDLPSPHAPPAATGWWRRLGERVRSGSRWRELLYLLVLFPLGIGSFVIVYVVISGSVALMGLPFYLTALPDESANFGFYDVASRSAASGCAVVGALVFAFGAPWLIRGLGRVNVSVARRLLGATRQQSLEAAVTRLEASRSAAVDSAESERRRIERDLHDGAQQRLVHLAMELGRAKEHFDTDPEQSRQLVAGAHDEAKAVLGDLRDLVRGFHPAVLEDRGLDAALSSVVARCPVPVTLSVDVPKRPSSAVESAAYFVVTEALTNVAKHAGAKSVRVSIARRGDRLAIDVSDDGRGGADAARGSGLAGLAERVKGLGGWMQVLSPTGGPTSVLVELPCVS